MTPMPCLVLPVEVARTLGLRDTPGGERQDVDVTICGRTKRPAVRAARSESPALGAAMLAAVGAGLTDEASLTGRAAGGTRFDPAMPPAERDGKLARWRRAIRATVAFAGG